LLKNTRQGIYFSSIGDIKDSRSDCHDKNQPIPQIFKTVVLVSVIPNPSLDPPSVPTAIHNVQLAIKDTNLPDINILHLKIVQKCHMTLTFSAANLKSFIKNVCVDFLA
jgi:hypothetical protein